MTLIMGARCVDGVVLVADRKVTLPDLSAFDYQDKLFEGIGHVIYGSSGSTGLYQLFVGHVEDYVRSNPGDMTYRNAVLKLSQIAFNIYRRYDFRPRYRYDLLVVIAPDDERSNLTFISGNGIPMKIDTIHTIGSGSDYVSIFTKGSYNQNMTMEQAAELGYFVIKYVEDFQLNMTVGVNDGIPQIWFMPDDERYANNVKKDYLITATNPETHDMLTRIQERVSRKLSKHRRHLKLLFTN
jgi:20S proteasome alpha/beta subunit